MNNYYKVAEALRFISNNATNQPTLDQVADNGNLSSFHFQKIFTDWAGVSPKKFLQFISLKHAKSILNSGHSVFEASYQAGLSGTSRLHDLFVNIEAMTPGQYKSGGKGLVIYYSLRQCQFGNYLVAATDSGICNLFFYENDPAQPISELELCWPKAEIIEMESQFHQGVAHFFDPKKSIKELKLHLKGTPFQLKVWEALLKIPSGKLASYSDVAIAIDKSSAQRAVGTAIGSNPVGYIIPCHRVIKLVGGIGDYRWRPERKMAMIGLEAIEFNYSKAG
jgi:AraC family transcriptional regulator of adaptative response/methylated-DNA-[protein]-cysteine methyltransferase